MPQSFVYCYHYGRGYGDGDCRLLMFPPLLRKRRMSPEISASRYRAQHSSCCDGTCWVRNRAQWSQWMKKIYILESLPPLPVRRYHRQIRSDWPLPAFCHWLLETHVRAPGEWRGPLRVLDGGLPLSATSALSMTDCRVVRGTMWVIYKPRFWTQREGEKQRCQKGIRRKISTIFFF